MSATPAGRNSSSDLLKGVELHAWLDVEALIECPGMAGNVWLRVCMGPGAQEGTWAGQQEQVALARLEHIRICIHQAGQPLWTIAPCLPDFPKVRIWP